MELVHKLTTEIKINVRYSETDQMQVAYHANYIIWFNIARDELIKKMGINICDGEKKGYLMPVVEVFCKYHFPARYGDEIIIKAVAEKSTVAKLVVHYRVLHGQNKRLLAEGKTVNVLMTKNGRLIIRVPEEYKEIMREILE